MKRINKIFLVLFFTLFASAFSAPAMALACLGTGEPAEQCAKQTCPYSIFFGEFAYALCL